MKACAIALVTVGSLVVGLPSAGAQQQGAEPLPSGDEDVTEEPAITEPPAPPPVADAKAVSLRYDGGFKLTSGDDRFHLKLGLRSQLRFELLRADVDDAEFQGRFSLPRVRLQFEGHAYGPRTGYKIELDVANRGFALLKDMYIDHELQDGLHVRLGQWKRPFNRQEIVSDFGSELLERSLVNGFSGSGRDLGLAVHNDYESSPEGVEWALGVFNAGSDRPTIRTTCEPGALPTDPPECTTSLPTNVPGDWGPALVARLGWNHGGIKGYSEGDLEGGPLRFAAAVSYKLDARDLEKVGDELQLEHAVVADAMVKVQGLGVSAALALVKDGQADVELGFYGQAGYMVVPKKVLAAVRFAQVPDGDEQVHEILGALNWFWQGHKVKWMIDGGVIHATDGGTNDLQIRTQLQLVL